jgi:hypothetical protein
MWIDQAQAIDLDKVRIELPAQEQYAPPEPPEVPPAETSPGTPAAPGDAAPKAPEGEQDSADAIQRELLRGTSPAPGK